MVRTRGLCRTLGKVLGRALGRQVSGDAEEVLQHRRPTISTHRQLEATIVAKDVDHVNHAAEEVHEEP